MKELLLSKGKVAIVDDEDFERLNRYKWSLNGMGRAHRKTKDNKNIFLHRQIMNPPSHLVVDHLDGDPLNNQRHNLKVCTKSVNLKNKRIYKNNTSGVKGITWDKTKNKWMARLFIDGTQEFIGYFQTLDEAKRRFKCL